MAAASLKAKSRLLHYRLFAFCFFFFVDFYVTFLSSWLLKWDLVFHALSSTVTMMGLRATDKMYPRVCGIYRISLIRSTSLTLLTSVDLRNSVFLMACHLPYRYSKIMRFLDIFSSLFFSSCQPSMIRATFMDSQAAFRSTKRFSFPPVSLFHFVCLN